MKVSFLFISLAFLSPIVLAQINPFSLLEYDKVVAYEFQGDGAVSIKDCLTQDTSKISKSIELSKKQVQHLENILTLNSSYGSVTASCFDPHFAIVYYKNNKIIGSINICLDCNYLKATPKIPATTSKTIQLTEDYSHPAYGFSKEARQEIHRICEELGFTKYLKPLHSMFDK